MWRRQLRCATAWVALVMGVTQASRSFDAIRYTGNRWEKVKYTLCYDRAAVCLDVGDFDKISISPSSGYILYLTGRVPDKDLEEFSSFRVPLCLQSARDGLKFELCLKEDYELYKEFWNLLEANLLRCVEPTTFKVLKQKSGRWQTRHVRISNGIMNYSANESPHQPVKGSIDLAQMTFNAKDRFPSLHQALAALGFGNGNGYTGSEHTTYTQSVYLLPKEGATQGNQLAEPQRFKLCLAPGNADALRDAILARDFEAMDLDGRRRLLTRLARLNPAPQTSPVLSRAN